MTKQFVNTFLLFVLFSSISYGSNKVKLDIKVKKIQEQNITCNILYSIKIEENDSIDFYTLTLPFKENSNLVLNLLSNEPDLYFTSGFRLSGNGLAIFNSLKKDFDFQLEIMNVELPVKNIKSSGDGLIINLNLLPEIYPYPFDLKNSEFLNFNTITIQTKSLLNSKPIFELSEEGAGFYSIKITKKTKSIFFVIPIPPESYLGTFLAFLFIAIFIGIVSAMKLIEGKNQSILGLIVSIIILGFLSFAFYKKVIPSDFNKDISMISLIGGGIGLALGILLNSAYNLIIINAIKKQQEGD